MPDHVTKNQLEGIMAGFQDQFRDFVRHFNKGQGILIQRFESVDNRLETVERRLDGIDGRLDTMEERNYQRFEDIEQRFVEVNCKLDLMM